MKTFKQFLSESKDYLTTAEDISAYLLNTWGYEAGDFTVNEDLTVDFKTGFSTEYGSHGDCTKLTHLPFKMRSVGGDLKLIATSNLESISELPKDLPWSFQVSSSKLTTLTGGPETVGIGVYLYNHPDLLSLEGFPRNKDKPLEKIMLSNLDKVHSLHGICDTKILHVFGQNVKMSLKDIEKMCPSLETLVLENCEITDSVLGLLELENLVRIKSLVGHDWVTVINNHLIQPDRNIFKCQQELIDMGYEKLAEM